ncbi:hypothetical protein [Streptomyces sp. NPDC097610]|uniref:hypothetical protein n=1 Tax=Streptomyces sp. NPDC097610 TaxID=3157227 RepID=UPI0033260CE8
MSHRRARRTYPWTGIATGAGMVAAAAAAIVVPNAHTNSDAGSPLDAQQFVFFAADQATNADLNPGTPPDPQQFVFF